MCVSAHVWYSVRISLLDTWIEFSDSSSCQPVAQFGAS